MPKKLNLIGQRFGRLVVIQERQSKSFPTHTSTQWLCKCDCGNEKIVLTACLRAKSTKSCGCLKIETSTKHGMKKHPLYSVLKAMLRRCNNPNCDGYKYYGARNVSVCKEWYNNPKAFIEWSISNGWQKGLQIDRIDNDGNYKPSNCRFATARENGFNKRKNSNNTTGYTGVFKTPTNKWIARIGINHNIINVGTFSNIKNAVVARNNYIIENHLKHKVQEMK